jgi:hypothetical protein
MKLILKLLAIVVILLAGVYAATPLWLPHVLAGQLPPGWRLETLRSSYPGLHSIRLKLIRVNGDFGPAALRLSATDLLVEYRSFKTGIGAVTADVFMQSAESRPAESALSDDLSIPVMNLETELPRLSIKRVNVALHLTSDTRNIDNPSARAVRLELDDLELTPGKDGGFGLAGQLSFEDSLRFTGALTAEVRPDLVAASIRFPSGEATPWLSASIGQETQQAGTSTRIEAVIDADAANRDWLDSVLARSTRRTVTQVGGRLSLDAVFTGRDRQDIERLDMTAEKLLLSSDTATLKMDADLSAGRQDDQVAVSLQAPATLEYEGDAGWLDQLLADVMPGLQVPHDPRARLAAKLATSSKAVISTTGLPSARFNGDLEFDLQSGPAHLVLKSDALQLDLADIRKPESAAVEGKAAIEWSVAAPLVYTADDLRLNAGTVDIDAEVIAHGGKLTSTGTGALTRVNSTDPVIAADQVDLAWENLELEALTGKMSLKTAGFSTEYDDQAWKGFDLDLSLSLLQDNDVSGAGQLVFTSGPVLPLEFTGNTQSARWDIRLAPATIRFAKLRSLLSVAGIKLPPEIKMTDGELDLQGDVRVSDEVTASMLIGGHDLIASLHNSRILGGGFNFKAGYDRTPRASGPLSIERLELAGDIDLRNIRAELEIEDVNRFEVKNLYAEVFDGRVELDSLQYSEDGIADTTLRLSQVDLGKLLAYVDVDGLRGSGTLDITLPIGSDKTGLHVKNGLFTSSGNGLLAYTKEGMAGSNIGLKALENFQYKSLSGTIDYQSDGAYLMSVRLEGSNPDLYSGHAVVFNLNINGVLPELFEAMFMTGSFEESILKQIKTR